MDCDCPQCSGEGVSLGTLGTREHFSCRQCGWEFSVASEPESAWDDPNFVEQQAANDKYQAQFNGDV